MVYLILAAGLVLLVFGAEFLVKGGAKLASILGISPLVIGLTIVAFGTSAPELVVSLRAAFQGQSDIALGNVVGSNIFNVLFILGLSALLTHLAVSAQLVRLDVPIMIFVSGWLWWICRDGVLSRMDGAGLFLGLVIYTTFLIFEGKKISPQSNNPAAEQDSLREKNVLSFKTIAFQILWVSLGLGLLVVGADWLLQSAVAIARSWGVSEVIIGLTIVAGGTSLPEVATSVLASLRGQKDIAVGNVVGSNIFNILGILGLTGILSPAPIQVMDSFKYFDFPIMITVALACLPIFFTGKKIVRWEGAMFLVYYLIYTSYLILHSLEHDILHSYQLVILWFIGPLTFVTIAVIVFQEIIQQRKDRSCY